MRISTHAQNENIGIITPSEAERTRMNQVADELHAELQSTGLLDDQVKAIDFLTTAGQELGSERTFAEIKVLIGGLATHSDFKVAVLETGALDESTLPPTPNAYRTPEDNPIMREDVLRAAILGLNGWNAFGYTSQQPGNVINDIVTLRSSKKPENTGKPAESPEREIALSAQSKLLGLHTEDASFNIAGGQFPDGRMLDQTYNMSPDVLSMYFLRNPREIPTTISAPDFHKLSDDTRATLMRPLFRNLTNPSQKENSEDNDFDALVPVLYGDETTPYIRANANGLVAAEELDDDTKRYAQQAIGELMQLLTESTVNIECKPGNLTIVHNKLALHGRAQYPSDMTDDETYGPKSRWQRRIVADYSASKTEPFEASPRIVDPNILRTRIGNLAIK